MPQAAAAIPDRHPRPLRLVTSPEKSSTTIADRTARDQVVAKIAAETVAQAVNAAVTVARRNKIRSVRTRRMWRLAAPVVAVGARQAVFEWISRDTDMVAVPPAWHHVGHARLVVHRDLGGATPFARFYTGWGHDDVMVVNRAFLRADEAEQKQVFNEALDKGGLPATEALLLLVGAAVLGEVVSMVMIGDRRALSKRRAAAVAAVSTATTLTLKHANRRAEQHAALRRTRA